MPRKPRKARPTPLLVPVEALVKHDRNKYPGDKYGLEPALVRNYVKRGLVKLNLAILDNPDAPEKIKDLTEELRAELYDHEVKRSHVESQPTGGRTDPKLEFLNGLAYNRGKESIVGFAKAVAEHIGIELQTRDRNGLTEFLLNNYETLEELRK